MRPVVDPMPAPLVDNPPTSLRLYIARSTPNSVRAEHNLSVGLDALERESSGPVLEIIDVFTNPKRAMKDGVVVTPTLIGISAKRRIVLMGDLSDPIKLKEVLKGFFAGIPVRPDDATDESTGGLV